MAQNTIRQVRAYVARGGGGDYHDQGKDHWIDGHIATPMAKYPAYRDSRQSFGLNVLGSLIVEIEADNGVVGFAVSTGGEPGAWIVEHHLARFLEGAKVADIEVIWEQMYLINPVLWPQGAGHQCNQLRGPRPVGSAGQTEAGARLPSAWRSGAR